MKAKTPEQFIKWLAALQPPSSKAEADKALVHLIEQAQQIDARAALAKVGRSL